MGPLAFVSVLLAYSLVSQRLERTVIAAPIVFTIAGMGMFQVLPSVQRAGVSASVFLRLAEVGLVLLLFTDANRTKLGVLRSTSSLAARLLSVGMLLTILLGAVVARMVFPNLQLWEAGILASILAPTDAGLGQVIVNSPRVPPRIREALSVEAGLNDGLSVPFLLLFVTLAAARTEGASGSLLQFIVEQLGLGTVVGLVVGLGGGWLIGLARRHEWMAQSFVQVSVVAVPLLCLVISELLGASMFIAAFVAGFAVQVGFKEGDRHSIEFAEEWGQVLNFSVFFIFGALVVRDWAQFGLVFWAYGFLSLTVVRMIPVAVSLYRAGLSPASVVFMGWFGPRGLASLVLGLVYLEQEVRLPGEVTIRLAVMVTVLMSIFAHGLSALPGIDLLSRTLAPASVAKSEHGG
jgi:sodium/hydrogen antiporter